MVFLKEHGYAVVENIIDEKDVRRAAKLLARDIATVNGRSQSVDLGKVTDAMLPNHANTGLRHRGLPHGEFAWFLREHPAVLDLWRQLYPSKKLSGVPAVVALTPPSRGNPLA